MSDFPRPPKKPPRLDVPLISAFADVVSVHRPDLGPMGAMAATLALLGYPSDDPDDIRRDIIGQEKLDARRAKLERRHG